jgi:hypothetical protein
MKRLLSLLLCFSLSVFSVAHAMTPNRALATIAKTAQKKPTGRKADAKTSLDHASKALAAMAKAERAKNQSFDTSEPEEQEVATEEDTDEEVVTDDDDSMEDASDDESEDVSGDDGGGDDGGDDGGD